MLLGGIGQWETAVFLFNDSFVILTIGKNPCDGGGERPFVLCRSIYRIGLTSIKAQLVHALPHERERPAVLTHQGQFFRPILCLDTAPHPFTSFTVSPQKQSPVPAAAPLTS